MKFQSFVLPDIKDWAYAGCKDKQTVWRPGKVHALDTIINLFKYLLKVNKRKRALFNFPPVIYVKVEIEREGKSLRIRHSFCALCYDWLMPPPIRDSYKISKLPLIQVILPYKVGCIKGSSDIPLISLVSGQDVHWARRRQQPHHDRG